jgi:hypothetical protein
VTHSIRRSINSERRAALITRAARRRAGRYYIYIYIYIYIYNEREQMEGGREERREERREGARE